MMNVLASSITVAAAAIADAGVDCVDLVSGGVAALVRTPVSKGKRRQDEMDIDGESGGSDGTIIVLDPCPTEHEDIVAACVVGYLKGRDEITELWVKGDLEGETQQLTFEALVDSAVSSAKASRLVLDEAIKQAIQKKLQL